MGFGSNKARNGNQVIVSIGGGGCCIRICSIVESRIFLLEQDSILQIKVFLFWVELSYLFGTVSKLIGYSIVANHSHDSRIFMILGLRD